jgi:hypothetical protein
MPRIESQQLSRLAHSISSKSNPGATVQPTSANDFSSFTRGEPASALIDRVYHLDRGYEHLEEKVRRVGAQIRRIGEMLPKKAAAPARG